MCGELTCAGRSRRSSAWTRCSEPRTQGESAARGGICVAALAPSKPEASPDAPEWPALSLEQHAREMSIRDAIQAKGEARKVIRVSSTAPQLAQRITRDTYTCSDGHFICRTST